MKIKSRYRTVFNIDNSDEIMWNESIYQLMTQKEHDNTYPVLNENEVRHYINNKVLRKSDEYITDFTRVKVTFYKKA